MAELWKTAREWLQKQRSRRNVSIPKLTQVLEVLRAQEEAKDHVYYDALRRISGSTALRLDEKPLRNDPSRSRKPPNNGTDRLNNSNLTPSSLEDIDEEEIEAPSSHSTHRFRSYILTLGENLLKVLRSERFVVDSEDDVYYLWMGFVVTAVFFNLWTVILRIAFIETTSEESFFRFVFWLGDLLTDGLYTCDIGVQLRTAYRDDQGIMIKDPMQLIKTYWKRRRFKIDLICLLPLETLYGLFFDVPCRVSILRLPRLLKWHSVETFFLLSDYRTSKPNHLRAFKLILYLSVAMHWVACLYYVISEYEGLGTNDWVYSETEAGNDHFTRKYVKSFYWSVLTLMTIGETPKPHTNLEYIFTGCMFLLGIFVFATVVGNVGDVISNMNAARINFQGRMDSIKQFMEHHKVPETLQTRVKRWAHYTWSRTKALEEGTNLEMLPERLRAEIAIHVHLETLRKVKIFKDCEQGLLCELVLKLRPQIFSPGDYICRCGEVGREMYIINNGKVEVVITNSTTGEEVVVASLSEGNYFGEISLLRLDGGRNRYSALLASRRSADVRSVGYSELLCLSQKDLMEALEEYPDAKTVLEIQGRDRLQRTKSEGTLAVPRPDRGTEKLHEMESNFAREMKEMRDILEELKEDFKEVHGRRKLQDLEEECFNLKEQIGKQMVELHSLKRQQSCHNNFIPAEDKRGNKSHDNAVVAEKLIQRLISAAAIASETTKASQNSRKLQKDTKRCPSTDESLRERTLSAQNTKTSQVSWALNCLQQETNSTNDRLLEETLDPPDIYLENDIDGLCYLGGARRRKPANSPLNQHSNFTKKSSRQ